MVKFSSNYIGLILCLSTLQLVRSTKTLAELKQVGANYYVYVEPRAEYAPSAQASDVNLGISDPKKYYTEQSRAGVVPQPQQSGGVQSSNEAMLQASYLGGRDSKSYRAWLDGVTPPSPVAGLTMEEYNQLMIECLAKKRRNANGSYSTVDLKDCINAAKAHAAKKGGYA